VFTSSLCSELLKLEGGQSFINTHTYVVWNLMGIDETEQLCSEEDRKTV
jgi:hypothetical protein